MRLSKPVHDSPSSGRPMLQLFPTSRRHVIYSLHHSLAITSTTIVATQTAGMTGESSPETESENKDEDEKRKEKELTLSTTQQAPSPEKCGGHSVVVYLGSFFALVFLADPTHLQTFVHRWLDRDWCIAGAFQTYRESICLECRFSRPRNSSVLCQGSISDAFSGCLMNRIRE